MVLLLCNWGNLCEQTVDYPKMNECFHMARYLCDNLLISAASDEIRRYTIRSQIDHQQKHKENIKEMGDINKIFKMICRKLDINIKNINIKEENHLNILEYMNNRMFS